MCFDCVFWVCFGVFWVCFELKLEKRSKGEGRQGVCVCHRVVFQRVEYPCVLILLGVVVGAGGILWFQVLGMCVAVLVCHIF